MPSSKSSESEGFLVERGLSYLIKRAFREGLLGGSRGWAIVGVVAVAVRWIRRSNKPVIVYSTELSRGQTLVISQRSPGG